MKQPFPIWVVHSPKLTDRKASCLASLSALGWSAQWMEAHEPGDLGFRFWLRHVRTPTLTWGEISVYAKHRAVLERVARTETPALVLEDDPIFGTSFASRAEPYLTRLPERWDFVFLGASCGLERPADPATPGFGRAESTRSMSGYLVTPEAARRAAKALRHRAIRLPIDLTMNAILRDEGMRTFWSVPALIQNGSETGRHARSVTGGRWRMLSPARVLRR